MTWHRRPRALHHPGRVVTERGWIPEAGIGRAAAEARAWAQWVPGLRVDRGPIGLLLQFPEPRLLCATDGVVPLVSIRDRWCAAPLDPRDVERHPADAVLVVQGFAVRATAPSDLEPVDLASWVDLDHLEVLATTPLGHPPAPPALVTAALVHDPRLALGISDAAPGAARLAQALAAGAKTGGRLRQAGRGAVATTLGWLARVGRLLTPSPREEQGGTSAPLARRGAVGWLESMAGRLGMASALGRLVGEQHLRYLQHMMGLFEGGNWEDALRHAIPLSDTPNESSRGAGWLSWLGPRPGLGLSGAMGGGGGVAVGPNLFEVLRQVYRRAFAELHRAGRVREAAYVLAELLDEAEEAVTYLEGHRELELAAEFAETKELDPGRVVSLWFQAGDRDRAIAIARRRGAFAAAIGALERKGMEVLAEQLRLTWARQEAASGRFAAAAEIVWPLEHARDEARDWLRLAMAVPGVAGAVALHRFAQCFPHDREPAVEALQLLIQGGAAARQARTSLAVELSSTTESAASAAWMAPPLARALLRDLVDTPSRALAAVLRKMLTASGAHAIEADLPPLPTRSGSSVRLAARNGMVIDVAPGDVGTVPVLDVLDLPGQRWLLALGELGLRIVDGTGHTLRTFATPAHRLVGMLSENLAVLVVAQRGRTAQVSKLDVVRQKLTPWIHLETSTFCPVFDGHVWFVGLGDRLVAIDVHADDARAVWSVPDLACEALGLKDGELQVAERGGELYRYRLPRLTLDRRQSPDDGHLFGVAAALRLSISPAWFGAFPVTAAEHVVFGPELAAVVGADAEGARAVDLYSGLTKHLVHRACVSFPGAATIRMRWLQYDPAIVDDRGRVRVINAATGHLRLDLRV